MKKYIIAIALLVSSTIVAAGLSSTFVLYKNVYPSKSPKEVIAVFNGFADQNHNKALCKAAEKYANKNWSGIYGCYYENSDSYKKKISGNSVTGKTIIKNTSQYVKISWKDFTGDCRYVGTLLYYNYQKGDGLGQLERDIKAGHWSTGNKMTKCINAAREEKS